MRLSRTKRNASIGFNMTPMIDIVFLLIIFFMTVSQITKTAEYPLDLPVVNAGATENSATEITINISRTGDLIFAENVVGLNRCIEIVKERIGGGDVSLTRVQIRCDRFAESRTVNRLVEKLANVGVSQVRVAVADDDRGGQ